MAQTPAERRARRDATARARINPDTGQPFRNYNDLDLWQRNQRARAQGFTSRAQKRGKLTRDTRELRKANELPQSFHHFLQGREPTPELAHEFNEAFNIEPARVAKDRKMMMRAIRARAALNMSSQDWAVWRAEYAGL